MKNLILIISTFFISLVSFSQVKMDVWNKSSKTGRSVTKLNTSKLPISFVSKLPDGNTEIYDKWDVPKVEVETSTKQKYTFKPNAYKGRKNLSVLTYTQSGWEGMYRSSTGEAYTMTSTTIVKDTVKSQKDFNDNCGTMIPPNTLSEKTPQKTIPQTSNLTNADYYNPAVPINKNLTVYAEVTNDLHVSLGNNLTTTQNWVTNLFLAVSSIYAAEGLTVTLNKIYVWQSVDPYGYQTTLSANCILGGASQYGSSFCTGFSDNINNNLPVNPNNTTTGVTSHFKHLLHGRGSLGGIAWLGGSSNGYNLNTWQPVVGTFLSTAVSGFTTTTLPSQPTVGYNWPVYVTAHELGHNFGSYHTHWCRWKNDLGATIGRLDSCYVGEYSNPNTFCPTGQSQPCADNCLQGTYNVTKPNTNGTIMSYCHLNGAVNLSRGVGKYPRFAMRSTVDQSPYIPNTVASLPSVTTTDPTSITSFTAVSGGNVISSGGGTLIARGVCWVQDPTGNFSGTLPTISDSKTNDGIATGVFTSNITGLTPATTYIIRAYATNSAGTSYGVARWFSSGPPVPPILTTVAINTIGQTSAKSGGTITNSGGRPITQKGVYWSTFPINTSPTGLPPTNTFTNDGTGTANFVSTLSGLTLGVTYYVRAYAINEWGTGWGDQLTFTTSTAVPPTVSTTSVTTFTNTTATMGGNVTASGGATVTRRGVCYATTTNPTIANSVVDIGTGTGSFSQNITGLSPGVTYYVRAFAENQAGLNYGTQQSFKTLTIPTVSTTAASSISTTSFATGGSVSSSGGTGVVLSAKGICYSTTTSPSLTNGTVITDPTTTTAAFTTNITNLTQGQTYYVRAYATNIYGTGYGSQITVKTFTVPTVTTTAASSITKTGFTTGGNVTSGGGTGQTVSERGIVYSTTVTSPTTTNTKVIAATPTGTGSYSISLTGLTPGTVYYVRSYAINSTGTGYGTPITVTTTNEPVLTTTAVTSISTTSASSGGIISSSAGSTVSAKGVCWSTSPSPTISLTTKTNNGTGTTAFTSSITGLSPSTTYYVRAYATNTTGTGYGNEISFTTTSSGSQPTLTTTAATGITQTTASSGGNVTADGGSTVTARGICYATTQNPTTSNTVVNSGTGTGVFTSSLSGLTPGTTYYIRAFATNSNGTNYGTQVSFTTLSSITFPTLTTNTVTSITSTSATSGGNITSDGGATVTSRGICYATTQNPTTSNTTIASGTGTGTFSVSITGLTSGLTYYVRAYATNSAGTNYGTQQSFTTLSFPTLSTTAASSVTSTTATTGGNITSDGGATVTARGVCYATTQNPTTSNTTVSSGTGTGTFTSNLTGLTANTLYYVRAYATNSVGTNYGTQISFTTTSTASIPSLTTTAVTSISSSGANTGGNVTSDGGASVTSRGICYNTSPTPTISNSVVNSGTGTGSFTTSLTGLSQNQIYYVRAFATNSQGTAYGNEVSFTTLTASGTVPTVTTTAISAITSNSASSGGNVTSAGSNLVTSRGVCWSTTPNPTISNFTTSNASGTGTYTSTLSSLNPSTTYYVKAYATSSAGTGYGNEVSFTTSSASGGSCTIANLTAYKSLASWKFKFDINSTCSSYSVNVTRYSNADPLIPPPAGSTTWAASGARLTNYVPTSTEISQGFIDQIMNPQPSTLNYWYSVDVKCNATICTPSPALPTPGLGNTRSSYFYNGNTQ